MTLHLQLSFVGHDFLIFVFHCSTKDSAGSCLSWITMPATGEILVLINDNQRDGITLFSTLHLFDAFGYNAILQYKCVYEDVLFEDYNADEVVEKCSRFYWNRPHFCGIRSNLADNSKITELPFQKKKATEFRLNWVSILCLTLLEKEIKCDLFLVVFFFCFFFLYRAES